MVEGGKRDHKHHEQASCKEIRTSVLTSLAFYASCCKFDQGDTGAEGAYEGYDFEDCIFHGS